MAAKQPRKQPIAGSYFQDIVDNIDIELISPLLRDSGIFSVEDEAQLKSKITRKQQVRFIISRIKNHPSGDDEFKNCLEKSRSSPGHQKLLITVYNERQDRSDGTHDDDKFLCDMKAAFRACCKESGRPVTVTLNDLFNKYSETHSNEEYRRNLNGKGLKLYLVQSGHFTVTGNEVNINEENNSQASKQNDKMSQPEEQPYVREPSTGSKQSNILVHFMYGSHRFPMRIAANDFGTFYAKVVAALQSKEPGCKPLSMQFQCGKEWYDFNEDTGFDLLCLNEDSYELSIQATPGPNSSVSGEMVSSAIQVSGKHKQNLIVNFANELKKGNSVPSSPTVEGSKDIDEKIVLKSTIESAMSYLQRSLAILIKSVFSRLCGTKATLRELHEINSKLHTLPEDSVKRSVTLNKIVSTSCKFWNSSCSEAEDWVWHCKQILPRKKSDPHQWDGVSEDLKSWKLDVCLKLINRAGFKFVENTGFKVVYRMEHDKLHLFGSEHISFETGSFEEYNFIVLEEKATEIRNYYAHMPSYADIIEVYSRHFKVIEDFATTIFNWVKCEDGDPKYVSVCQENVLCIKQKRASYLLKHTAKWASVLNGLKNLNFNDFGYILVSTPYSGSAGPPVSKEDLAQLSNIPWAAIVDFDVASRQDGLWHSLCELEGGQYRLKVSCQSPSKSTVVPFSYADIDAAERGELCRDGRIPWIFPHGELQNRSSEACPLDNYQQYCLVVRKPLSSSMRKITSDVIQNRSQGTVSVVLCYGDYGYKSENLPYDNFLNDLRHLCNNLSDDGGHVIILSDSLYLMEYLKPLPVFIIPLLLFCKGIKSDLQNFGQDKVPSISMPSSTGLRHITFDEEDFELVHEHIAKYELYKHTAQKITELRQKNETVSETIVKASIQHEVRENFYKGQTVTWISLNADHAITRREENEITSNIRQMLNDRLAGDKTEPAKYVIYHSAGAGATTLSKKIIWNLRMEYPCVVLKSKYKHSDGRIKCTGLALKCLYDELQYPILMLIDEEPSFKTIPSLIGRVQVNGTPMVFLQVQRFDPTSADHKMRGVKDSYILPSALHTDDANKLKQKLYTAFGQDRIFAGDRNVAEMESSMATPSKGDTVTDLARSGVITESVPKTSGLDHYYLVKVAWEDSTEEEEECIIGSFAGKAKSGKYQTVYLDAEISKVYGTFYFYGIMYLDEEFRDPMYKHIQQCLSVMLPHKKTPDDEFENKLLVLAYLSILFAFKVCESIHIKAFENLCYSVTKSSKVHTFKLEAFVPKAALQFMIITREGQFRIIHPIVAHEIIKFYSSSTSRLSDNFPPTFVCKFLNYMLPDGEFQNVEATLAINRLLRYREYVNDGTGYLTRKLFSELILTLDKQNPDHAVEVLSYASEVINNCHSYGHYARYMSKKIQDYDRALEILKSAETLAFQCYEKGLVLNIKGDVYREKLQKYLKKTDSLDWKDEKNKPFEFHFYACKAYQESYKKHQDDFPLFNELVVRLDLLEAMKKSSKSSEKFLRTVHGIVDAEVTNSIDTCFELVKKLNEYICGEGFNDLDVCNDEAHVKSLENRLLTIIGTNKQRRKEILFDLMTKFGSCVNLPNVRRSYIHLCELSNNPIPKEMDICLEHLEKNFEEVGHFDRDMMNWLLIVRGLPDIGGDTKIMEERLISWKNRGPCITSDTRNIQVRNDPLLVNFYLTICYFIQMIENEEERETSPIVKRFKDVQQAMKAESKNNKSQFRIKEWLDSNGTGFGRLRSGQIIPGEMMLLTGSIGIPSWQEAHQSRGDKGFPYVSWKGLCIRFDAKRYSKYHLKQGTQVTFGVGFTFTGPQAVVSAEASSSVPSSPIKTTSEKSENQGQQPVQAHMLQKPSYSQATKSKKMTETVTCQQPSKIELQSITPSEHNTCQQSSKKKMRKPMKKK